MRARDRALPTVSLLCGLALLSGFSTACSGGAAAEPQSAGSGSESGPDAPTFDAARAWGLLEAQVALGPRPSGSAEAELNRRLIEEELRGAGLQPVRQTFMADTPIGPIEMANVHADLVGREREGEPAPIVILCSHYDTKRMESHPEAELRTGRFVGANDGASSTAVLLEAARALARGPRRDVTYRFLFVDGEEATRWHWQDPDNRYGSRHHAKELRRTGQFRDVKAAAVIDMVGDAEFAFTHDEYSDQTLLAIFFDAARRLGLEEATKGSRTTVRDDHLSFSEIGIPSCDLIDMDFVRRDEQGREVDLWHTIADTPANCSQASLDKAGRVLLAGLARLEAHVLR